MASQSKSDASRANGAKSKGPVTAEGKARSSQNALKHGLTAQLEALPGESQEDFDALLESHMTQYQPVGALEEDLVQTLAATRWRLRRIPSLESNILENETILREEEIDEDFSHIDDSGRLGFVFGKLADHSKVLSLLIRYESSLTRNHDRVFKHLVTLQKLRNEPKPTPPGGASFSFEHRLQPMSSPTSTPQPAPPENAPGETHGPLSGAPRMMNTSSPVLPWNATQRNPTRGGKERAASRASFPQYRSRTSADGDRLVESGDTQLVMFCQYRQIRGVEAFRAL